jgi:Ca2+-binding EF-hand superfamily protein
MRLTAEAALEHPFIANRHFEDETQDDVGIVKALRDYGHQSRFRRCCMSMMAWSLSSEERSKVEQYFLALDIKHHGAIYYDDLKKVMVDKFHIPQGEAKRAFNALDSSHHKEIHYSDFLAAMITKRVDMNEDLIHEAFRKFDTDDSGYITAENLREVIGDTFEGLKVEKLLSEADTLHHGRLSYHEFASYLKGQEMHFLGDEGAGMGLEPAVDLSLRHQGKCNGVQPCCSLQ